MDYRFRHIFAACVCIGLSLSSPAAAYTETQKQAAVENLAMISIAKKWCSDYQVDQETTVAAAIMLVDITKEPYASQFADKRDEAEKMVGKFGTTAFCSTVYKLFGPERGLNLIMKK